MASRKLTIEEANRIADGLVTVTPDEIDPTLWHVQADGIAEAHEPMSEILWRRMLRSYAEIAEMASPDEPDNDELADALRENLSPRAVAGIAACLKNACTNDADADCFFEIDWFRRKLVEMTGGENGEL